jgi:N-acetylglutamate synthase-like GNAT family acetyltransferase
MSGTIRDATASDVPALVALINAAFAVEWDFVDRERTSVDEINGLRAKGTFLVVDGSPGELRACVYLEPRGARMYLGMLAVHPAQQKRGLGRQVMGECERRCRAWGATAIDIRIVNRRTELPAIYAQMGFIDRGTEPFEDPLLKKPCHFILMSKDLE